MTNSIEPSYLFQENEFKIILDVRSPAEFEKGHIPRAINFPLFNNEERAIIGTLFKQVGAEQAMLKGLDLIGPKMGTFAVKAKEIIKDKSCLIHCWRGGKRSSSMSWLLNNFNLKTSVLKGGYKSYRKEVRNQLQQIKVQYIVLGGRTGSGKTSILKALKERGEQIIDLEGLANHKGSAFGWIGEREQPSIEQFENQLLDQILSLDLAKHVWIENESRTIGSVYLPEGFWQNMKSSPLINIEVPETARIKNLVSSYSLDNQEELNQSFKRIKKRIGDKAYRDALELVANGDFKEAASVALTYYDKTYKHLLDTNKSPNIILETFKTGDPENISMELIKIRKQKLNDRRASN